MSNVDLAIQEAFRVLKPPPKLTVSQWADEYRYLSQEDSAEPGRWNTSRAEYQRGIMDAISDPLTPEVVVMSSAQIGKTQILNNIIGFHIDQDPAPILMVQPTLELGEAWSKDRFVPMLRDTPRLQGKVKDARSRDSGNTLLHKVFPGGHITIAGSNSPASLASRPIRIVLCDEVDRYPLSAGTEGDPVRLAKKRSTTFWNKKIVLTSTPTITGLSRIEKAFGSSDKRKFFVPCPDCGEYQFLKWAQVTWAEGKPETAEYACEHCGCFWDEPKRNKAVSRGEWRSTEVFNGIAGFHLNEIYSPWVKLGEMAKSFIEATKGGQEQLKTWVNTSLGETWQERGEAPDWERIHNRRESYERGIVPAGGILLVVGVDVQKDRLELEVVAFGVGRESWSVDYLAIDGDTSERKVWGELDILLAKEWPCAGGGRLPIMVMGIDIGYRPQMVYQYAARHPNPVHGPAGSRVLHPQSVMPIKGADENYKIIANISSENIARKRRGLKIVHVGTGYIKQEFYDCLRLSPLEEGGFPPGYCHFPQHVKEYFQGICSEKKIVHESGGRFKVEWVKSNDIRNEPLDCRVYARAAAAIFGIDRMKEHHWLQLAAKFGIAAKRDIGTPANLLNSTIPTAPLHTGIEVGPEVQAATEPIGQRHSTLKRPRVIYSKWLRR